MDSTGDSMGMGVQAGINHQSINQSIIVGVQAGRQTLSFEAMLLDVLEDSSVWKSDVSTAASVMRCLLLSCKS